MTKFNIGDRAILKTHPTYEKEIGDTFIFKKETDDPRFGIWTNEKSGLWNCINYSCFEPVAAPTVHIENEAQKWAILARHVENATDFYMSRSEKCMCGLWLKHLGDTLLEQKYEDEVFTPCEFIEEVTENPVQYSDITKEIAIKFCKAMSQTLDPAKSWQRAFQPKIYLGSIYQATEDVEYDYVSFPKESAYKVRSIDEEYVIIQTDITNYVYKIPIHMFNKSFKMIFKYT